MPNTPDLDAHDDNQDSDGFELRDSSDSDFGSDRDSDSDYSPSSNYKLDSDNDDFKIDSDRVLRSNNQDNNVTVCPQEEVSLSYMNLIKGEYAILEEEHDRDRQKIKLLQKKYNKLESDKDLQIQEMQERLNAKDNTIRSLNIQVQLLRSRQDNSQQSVHLSTKIGLTSSMRNLSIANSTNYQREIPLQLPFDSFNRSWLDSDGNYIRCFTDPLFITLMRRSVYILLQQTIQNPNFFETYFKNFEQQELASRANLPFSKNFPSKKPYELQQQRATIQVTHNFNPQFPQFLQAFRTNLISYSSQFMNSSFTKLFDEMSKIAYMWGWLHSKQQLLNRD